MESTGDKVIKETRGRPRLIEDVTKPDEDIRVYVSVYDRPKRVLLTEEEKKSVEMRVH
jgi:hypothetical protein